ncbi:SNF2 family N-terminal domain-containing protein [Kalaharituber pfeilii]|nr:SNF2 family N-terminal domain-containing protein [Kalaharituber pfeilii]
MTRAKKVVTDSEPEQSAPASATETPFDNNDESYSASNRSSEDEEEEEEEEDEEDEEDEEEDEGEEVQQAGYGDEDVSMEDADNNADDDDTGSEPVVVDGRRRRSDVTNLRKKEFGNKHSKLDKTKTTDTAKRYSYLLGLTDLFRHFIGNNEEFQRMIAEADKKKAKGKGGGDHRRRRTEQEEDEELLNDEKGDGTSGGTIFTESPSFIKGGQMRDYQIAGLNWLISLHENGISGILADEMGLGKTLQTISFLGYLRYICGVNGPHLIMVPKSTLDNWKREFEKWTPEVRTLVLQGPKEDRAKLINERVLTSDFDVLITSYEMKFAWEYIIVDEAHRIKNEESSLAQIIRLFHSRNRLLITGTPLQNNLRELWALLNFLLPDVFGDSTAFDQWFEKQGGDQDMVVKQLHKVLRPFLLRRVKSDVEKSLLPKKELNLYIGMSEMQVKWYQKILEKDIDAVNGAGGKRESKTRLLNIVMQLRKCCNHPYLFEGAEPGPPYTTDEHLVYNSAKMVMLDKILKRMKAQGSRVLIFSQMSRMLDILEDYCLFREYQYCRIDGSTAHEDRIAAIDEYNKPDSEKFIFLLTTRAGGLGINLTSADIVILYDSDWNPQADLQAMDRAHRIGQKKQVHVFRFITENAIEEKVLERAAQKLRLDQLVIQQGRAQQAAKQAASKDELLSMIQHGAADIFNPETKGKNVTGPDMTDDEIDAIFRHGEERTKELNERYAKLGIDDLQKFTSDSAYEWNGEDFAKIKKPAIGVSWINPAKRERKEAHYSIDKYYRGMLNPVSAKPAEAKPKAPKAPKQVNVADFQFYPPRLVELQEKETAYFRKQQGYKVPAPEIGEDEDASERENERALEQEIIDNAVPLTEEEEKEKAELAEQGFSNWTRREFQQFIQLSAKYGRNAYGPIASEMEAKTEKEVRAYAKVFWERYTELFQYEKYINQIEQGEEKTRRVNSQKKMLRKKMEMYRVPLVQLKINYTVSTTNKKVYTDEEDRFLLCQLDKHGLDAENLYEKIRDEIRESPLFRFDWFFLSRTPIEIGRRCTTLISTIVKEFEEKEGGMGSSGSGGGVGGGTGGGISAIVNGDAKKAGATVEKKGVKGRERDEEEEEVEAPVSKKGKTGHGGTSTPTATAKGATKPPPKNKQVENTKSTAAAATKAASSNATSRATSVGSTTSSTAAAAKSKGKVGAAAAAAAGRKK